MGNHSAVFRMRPDDNSPVPVVVITGATKGIGKEVALRYARRGCFVVLAARGVEGLKATKEACEAEGAAACLAVPTDVTNEEACAHLMREVHNQFGRIDVLVLNAGVSAHFPFSEFADMELFRRLFDVNFFGYDRTSFQLDSAGSLLHGSKCSGLLLASASVYCTKHALPHLRRTRGQIVVISSLSGEIGLPLRSAYCATKFAVTGFFEALRMEVGDQINVTICCPPSVKTGMRDEKAFAAAERLLEQLRTTTDTAVPDSDARQPMLPQPETSEKPQPQISQDRKSPESKEISIDRRMPVEQCVDYIMKAADRRARKVMFPLYSYLAVYAQPFLPDIVDPLIKRAAKL